MNNAAQMVPGAVQSMIDLTIAIRKIGIPAQTLELTRMRVSQVNGRALNKENEADELLLTELTAWRDTPRFNDAERAALGLAEAVTLLSDPEDPVPDKVWEEATQHYNEQEIGALLMHIGMVNLWNRVNIATQQSPRTMKLFKIPERAADARLSTRVTRTRTPPSGSSQVCVREMRCPRGIAFRTGSAFS